MLLEANAKYQLHEGEQHLTHILPRCQTRATENRQAGTFKQRIGSTVYHVNVYHSQTSQETAQEKITRLVKNDISVVMV